MLAKSAPKPLGSAVAVTAEPPAVELMVMMPVLATYVFTKYAPAGMALVTVAPAG